MISHSIPAVTLLILWVLLCIHSTISYKNKSTAKDPLECQLYFWLAARDSFHSDMIPHMEHDCMDHFIQHKDVESFCLKNGEVCVEYGRHYAHKVTPEMNRRILKGSPPVPPPTDSRRPTGSPSRFPTLSPTLSPTMSPTVSEETINSLFYKYPDGICFGNMSDFGSEYAVIDPNSLILTPYSVISSKDFTIRNQILTKYRFGPTAYAIFIFEGELLKYIVNRQSLSNKVDFKTPQLTHTQCTIYERRFKNTEPNVYINKYFGYTNLTKEGFHRKDAEKYIMMATSEMTYDELNNMEALCSEIPRCLGYIPSMGLVSSLAKRKNPTLEPLDNFQISYIYVEKSTRHDIFSFMSRNNVLVITLWSIGSLGSFVLVFFPSVVSHLRLSIRSLFLG